MSLALKFGNFLDPDQKTSNGFVYIDAVTQYGRDFKGQLTSHPIGSGSNISDHFIRNNPVYQFTGIISGADISLGRYLITDYEGNRPSNTNEDIRPVRIKSQNSLLSLIPYSISSFFVDAENSVDVSTTSRRQKLSEIRVILEKLFENNQVQICRLFEYDGTRIVKMIDNLVMTSLSFEETPESGYSLEINITLEQATFTALKTTKLTKKDLEELNADKVKKDIKPIAKPVTNLGRNPSKDNLVTMSPEQKAAWANANADKERSALAKLTELDKTLKDLNASAK